MDPQAKDPKDTGNQQPQVSVIITENEPAVSAEPDDYSFYNIMPKTKTGGGIVEAEIPTGQPPLEQTAENPTENIFKKYKVSILIILGALILTVAAYFAYQKFFVISEENILAEANNLRPTSKDSNTSNSSTSPVSTKEWQKKYFNSESCGTPSICGEDADPDRDGLVNKEEFDAGADPNNPDSDQDGLADGDEKKVFGTNPLQANTNGDTKYSDKDYIRDGYDVKTKDLLTESQIFEYTKLMKEYGLHDPTIKSLKDTLVNLYKFTDWNITFPTPATTTPKSVKQPASGAPNLAGIDMSLEAKQDRDAQRSSTIKNIGIALVKYSTDTKTYPKTTNFKEMVDKIKPYLKVATNAEDPINQDPFIYTYTANTTLDDFTISFYSELANQIIKKRASDSMKDKSLEEAAVIDDQRKNNLQTLRTALLLYSNKTAAGNQDYVFPTPEKYKTDLVPNYISQIPKDPKTKADYEYKVSETFNTFTLKTLLDNPPAGTSGYLCNQEECQNY